MTRSPTSHKLARTNTVTHLANQVAENKEDLLSIGKVVLHSVLLLLFWIWWDLFGFWLLPLYIYVALLVLPIGLGAWSKTDRMGIRSVVIIYFTVLSMPLLAVWCILRGGRFAATALALYWAWAVFIDKAPTSGGRFCPALRRRKFWIHFAAYFPMSLTRSAELDPSRNYLFGYHPHGIISLGALCNFATYATGFDKLFPGVDLRLLTLAMNFKIPFFREYLLGMGINDASRRSCQKNLTRGPGASIMLVVGGARESLETAPGTQNLVLGHRKGFVKMAIRTGADLVPVFSFGENDVFGVYHNDKLKMWQLKMQKKLGFAVPFFFGRALTGGVLHRFFGLNVGVMPLRVPMHTVVGKPIHIDKVENPSQELIDEKHRLYIEELKRLYDEWKDQYKTEREEALKHMDPERLKIQQASCFELDDHEEMSLVD